jgi:CPA1 family monovalent cation:H+ antiporter
VKTPWSPKSTLKAVRVWGRLIIVFIAIILLVAIANRVNVSYPIVLVLGGIAIGYIPGIPTFQLPPELVLLVFLPPLLHWESVCAPTSQFRTAAAWIFQMAFGLVIVTTAAVAAIAHAIVPGMSWGVAFLLGAIVSSTDEVAVASIADKLNIPRHIIGTIESPVKAPILQEALAFYFPRQCERCGRIYDNRTTIG